MTTGKWPLGIKLAFVQAPFILLAMISTAATLWVSWQLDGGAAAVNEAGRMRMQAYRMALVLSAHGGMDAAAALAAEDRATLAGYRAEFERSLELLRRGDPERPLFMPWDDTVRARFEAVDGGWQRYTARLDPTIRGEPPREAGLRDEVAGFAGSIDALVGVVEAHMSRWTAIMHLLQAAMLAMLVLAVAVLVYTGYLLVLDPVARLKRAIERLQSGDLGARVEGVATSEFATLADGFNGMAERIQSVHRDLEMRVADKTAELREKQGRLEALYEVTALIAHETTPEALADGFVARLARIAKADGVRLAWREPGGGMGELSAHGESDGRFETVVAIPVRLHETTGGEIRLLFRGATRLSDPERSLLDALADHLAAAMENLRLSAMDREAAVSEERGFIARELHDSIAQSLAFLRIQVQLMRDALAAGDPDRAQKVLADIDEGVRESYGDVRELLLQFRTRPVEEGLEPALRATLQKFERQSGVAAALSCSGHGRPLAPDVQLQVLHIVQGALSNVRKHARAGRVWVDVVEAPDWSVEVRDDGVGFDPARLGDDGSRVGLRIMDERARRIRGRLECFSTPGRGTSVILTLPREVASLSTARAA